MVSLGVDAVWLSLFYPSSLADGGYDEMNTALHTCGIKLIVDIVPNHTSDRHEWFRQAVAAPKGSPARDRYVFRNGLGAHGDQQPPDWQLIFGGPVWEWITEPDGTPEHWYRHLFAKKQPDLNLDNDKVREDFLTTLRFWSDRGVDGFRVDVAHAYASPKGLGRAFKFDLLTPDFDAEQFRAIITKNLTEAAATGASSTWVFSNHHVVRHPTRYGFSSTPSVSTEKIPTGAPIEGAARGGKAWLLAGAPAG